MNPVRNTKALEKENKISNGVKFADLHLHTIFSDGTYQPEEVVKQAKQSGLSCISVVDHDTTEGLEPTLVFAKEYGIEIIPGIELSADYNNAEVHILGYFIDYHNKELLDKLKILQNNRNARIYKMVDKLNGLGLKLEAEEVFNISEKGTVGRLHIARAMLKAGLVKSAAEAFNKYIGDKGPAYFCGFKLKPKEAISLIRKARGIPVLAHPRTLNEDKLILDFIEDGIMGLEVFYPEYTKAMTDFYLGLAKQYDLLVTGGSDCHGSAKPEIRIGSVKIPYDLVEKLKSARDKLK